MIHTRVGRVGGLGCVLQWRGPSRWKRVQCSGRGTGDGRMGSGSRKTGHGETGSHNTGHGETGFHEQLTLFNDHHSFDTQHTF